MNETFSARFQTILLDKNVFDQDKLVLSLKNSKQINN